MACAAAGHYLEKFSEPKLIFMNMASGLIMLMMLEKLLHHFAAICVTRRAMSSVFHETCLNGCVIGCNNRVTQI